MKYVIADLLLWAIALAVAFFVVTDAHALTIIGPVFAVCMIGSIVVVQRAASGSRSDT